MLDLLVEFDALCSHMIPIPHLRRAAIVGPINSKDRKAGNLFQLGHWEIATIVNKGQCLPLHKNKHANSFRT